MEFLPKDLENIILDYKYQLEHTEKSKKYLNYLKNTKIEYEPYNDNDDFDDNYNGNDNGTIYSMINKFNIVEMEIIICSNCFNFYYCYSDFIGQNTIRQYCCCYGMRAVMND